MKHNWCWLCFGTYRVTCPTCSHISFISAARLSLDSMTGILNSKGTHEFDGTGKQNCHLKWNTQFLRELNISYFAPLSQFHFAAVCHIVTFTSCSTLDIWKSNFLQGCVQVWASKVFIKWARLFWCWGRGDRWKGVRSYQGLIKNQLIFINFICHF